jgi:hypothetical protein
VESSGWFKTMPGCRRGDIESRGQRCAPANPTVG